MLDRIPRSSWRPDDWVNYTWAASVVGRIDDAVSASKDIPWDSITDPGTSHTLNANVVWVRCHSNTPPSEQELEHLLAGFNGARQYWTNLLDGPRATQANVRLAAKSEEARNPGVLPLLLAERHISHDKITDSFSGG